MKLLLFHAEPALTLKCRHAGMDGMILDLERRGKEARQEDFDTQISVHDLRDLEWLRAHYDGPIICRVNGGDEISAAEVRGALALGADEILLPMITRVDQVQTVLDWLGTSARLGIMLETREALGIAGALSRCRISRAYVGLNDLAISLGNRSIFRAMVDGTVEALRARFDLPFGVAGLTHPALGSPIPSSLLLAEMKRLDAHFSFLRRSFYRDLASFEPGDIIAAIRDRWNHPSLLSDNPRGDLADHVNRLEPRVTSRI